MNPKSPPAPPSAKELTKGQFGASEEAARRGLDLSAISQSTPFGNLMYKKDAGGRYSLRTTLAPRERRALRRDYRYGAGIDRLVGSGIKSIRKLQRKPFELGNDATEARLFELGSARLDPKFEQGRAALDTNLRNQGVMPGTEAYRRAVEQYGQQENDAYNHLLLTGRAQAANESLAERNQPFTELGSIAGLRRGVQYPSFQSTPQVNIDTPNVGDYAYNEYKYGPYAQWQADEQNRQAKLGALFGLAGTAASLPFGGWG